MRDFWRPNIGHKFRPFPTCWQLVIEYEPQAKTKKRGTKHNKHVRIRHRQSPVKKGQIAISDRVTN